jgi:cytochrome c553
MEKTTMKRRLVNLSGAILLAAGLALAHAEDAEDVVGAVSRTAATRIAVGTCSTCHGPQGHSLSPKFPVLAGKHTP